MTPPPPLTKAVPVAVSAPETAIPPATLLLVSWYTIEAAPTVIAAPASTEIVTPLLIWTLTSLSTCQRGPRLDLEGAREDVEELGRRRGRQGIGQRDGPTGEVGGVDVDVLEDDVAGQQRDVGDGHGDGQVEGVAGQVALVQQTAASEGETVPGEVGAGGDQVAGG